MKKLFYFVMMIFVIFFISSCDKRSKNSYVPEYSTSPLVLQKTVYIFGVHPLHNPTHLFKVYQPMIKYINARLEDSELRLEASRNYAAYDKKLFSGYFDFSLPNPYQTVTAVKNGYKIFGKMGDDENFRGIILVRKDSSVKEVNDLKGKTVSYPAPTALAATMMPQWFLYQNGLDINNDIVNSYVGSQESSIMNVYLGKSMAAATWPPPWLAFMKERPEIAKDLIVKWQTSALPNNGLVVRADVPQDLVDKVSEIIFNLHTHEKGREILKAMELSRYERATNRGYDPVRKFLKKFEDEVRPIRMNDE